MFGISNPSFGRRNITSDSTKTKLSRIGEERYLDSSKRKITSESVKIAMHRPEVRKKHIDALASSRWLKVKTDKGQIEMLEKWNKLGFNFDINYQLHTDTDLFYIDGYDKEKNVVFEYDSKYHKRPYQMKTDLIRENKIIDILNPIKFWRYDSVNKQFRNVLAVNNLNK